jgi:hypothetical protein
MACNSCKASESDRWYQQRTICGKCYRREYYRRYYHDNRDKLLAKQNIYASKNKVKAAARKAKRLKDSVEYRLICNLRARLYIALKNKSKTGSAVEQLGCTGDFLKTYLESKFLPGMSWENYGRNGWHIDHIVPLSGQDLTDPTILARICHYTNLQPLWRGDNISKSNKR